VNEVVSKRFCKKQQCSGPKKGRICYCKREYER
jgi:hypothetical protein